MVGVRMARVLAKFFATVREATGVRSAEFEVKNIRELLDILSKTYPKFSETVLKDDSGELKQFYSCMVNGRRIELLDSYDTVLKDNDAVALFPPVGGG
jgi:molybdopterin synthase sulfur carrier subunit